MAYDHRASNNLISTRLCCRLSPWFNDLLIACDVEAESATHRRGTNRNAPVAWCGASREGSFGEVLMMEVKVFNQKEHISAKLASAFYPRKCPEDRGEIMKPPDYPLDSHPHSIHIRISEVKPFMHPVPTFLHTLFQRFANLSVPHAFRVRFATSVFLSLRTSPIGQPPSLSPRKASASNWRSSSTISTFLLLVAISKDVGPFLS